MIRNKSEYIFATDSVGNLIFSTSKINYNQKDWIAFNKDGIDSNGMLREYTISGEKFLGISYFRALPGILWNQLIESDIFRYG